MDAAPKVKAASDDKGKKASSEEKSSEAEEKKAGDSGTKGRMIQLKQIYGEKITFLREN